MAVRDFFKKGFCRTESTGDDDFSPRQLVRYHQNDDISTLLKGRGTVVTLFQA